MPSEPYKRPGSAFWWVTYTNSEGVRVRESTKKTEFKDAETFLSVKVGAVQYGSLFSEKLVLKPKIEVPKITLNELFKDYVSGNINLSKEYYESSLKCSFAFLLTFFGDKPINEIEGEDLLEYRKARLSGAIGTLSNKTGKVTRIAGDTRINKDILALSGVFRWALTEKKYASILKANPVIGEKHLKKIESKRKGYLDAEGKQKFIDNCKPWMRKERGSNGEQTTFEKRGLPVDILLKIVRVLWTTGLRVEECLSLQKYQIKFRVESIELSADATKSNKDRTVPFLTGEVREIFEDECKGKKDGEFVFQWNGKPISYDAVYNAFDRVVTACEFKAIGIHSLRKTAAIDMYVEHGKSLVRIKRILGHANISTTMIYVDEEIIADMEERKERLHILGTVRNEKRDNGSLYA